MKTFVIIDGHALIYRGYYAIPQLRTRQGELVNAVYGFSMMLLNMLIKLKPDYLAVAFDLKGPTFRHEAYEGYKATRSETPDDLIPQVPRVRQVVEAFQIPVFQKEGFEADDLIGTLAKKIEAHPDVEFLILSGDMDLTQLITDQVNVLAPLSGFNEAKRYDAQAVMDKYGIWPHQMVDYKALVGDTSDNIPGVMGIGKKTASKLLFQYETLDGVYEHLDEINGSVHDKLAKDKEMAYKSQHLAQIIVDVPADFDLEACHTHEVNGQQVKLLFGELEFNRLMPKFEELCAAWREKEQPALF
jgi:DNA polymerase I